MVDRGVLVNGEDVRIQSFRVRRIQTAEEGVPIEVLGGAPPFRSDISSERLADPPNFSGAAHLFLRTLVILEFDDRLRLGLELLPVHVHILSKNGAKRNKEEGE